MFNFCTSIRNIKTRKETKISKKSEKNLYSLLEVKLTNNVKTYQKRRKAKQSKEPTKNGEMEC